MSEHEPVFHVSGLEAYVNRLLSCHDTCLGRGEFNELVQHLKTVRREALFQPIQQKGCSDRSKLQLKEKKRAGATGLLTYLKNRR